MLDIDNIMLDIQGMDMTSSPASNAGDPLARKVPIDEESTAYAELAKLFSDSSDLASVELDVSKVSKEAEKKLDETLENFKVEDIESDYNKILGNLFK